MANEVIKGTQQKVSAGGTPHVAPVRYVNVRELVEGRESRTVILDEERAPLVRWAFEAYASGDYTLSQLAEALRGRGLTQHPTPSRAVRSLPDNKLHAVLRNRYYLGNVTWRGVEYPGKHPALVGPGTFAAVKRVLASHRQSGERSRKHQQYLSGSLFCARCRSRLLFGVATGRRGDKYEYFFCAGRHTGRTGCDLPYLPLEQVEAAVVTQWERETFPTALTQSLRHQLAADLRALNATTEQEQRRLTERVAAIRRERYKWAEKSMEGVIPVDIAREKQQALVDQLLAAESSLSQLSMSQNSREVTLNAVLDLVDSCGRAYRLSEPAGRRDYNQTFFSRSTSMPATNYSGPLRPASGARRYLLRSTNTARTNSRARSTKNNNAAGERAPAAPTMSVFRIRIFGGAEGIRTPDPLDAKGHLPSGNAVWCRTVML